MLLGELRVLLGNAKYQISGAAAKTAIETMIEQIEQQVLNGEEVKLTIVEHKNTGIIYLLCNAAAVDEKKFVCVSLYGSNPKVYAASTLKRMFRKTVATLEVAEEDKADTADSVPAAVDTDDTVPAVPVVPVDTEAADKTKKPAESDPEVQQTPPVPAANNKFSRDDYTFFESKTNKLAAEIIKYFCSRGYEAQIVCDYVRISKNKHSIAKIYHSKKGNVRMAINPVCEQEFKRCFQFNKYSFVPQWTLSLKVFIEANDDLRTIHKFLSIVDKLHSEKYGKEVS